MELERLLKEALAQLTPAQKRRLIAHIIDRKSKIQLAGMEGVLDVPLPTIFGEERKPGAY